MALHAKSWMLHEIGREKSRDRRDYPGVGFSIAVAQTELGDLVVFLRVHGQSAYVATVTAELYQFSR